MDNIFSIWKKNNAIALRGKKVLFWAYLSFQTSDSSDSLCLLNTLTQSLTTILKWIFFYNYFFANLSDYDVVDIECFFRSRGKLILQLNIDKQSTVHKKSLYFFYTCMYQMIFIAKMFLDSVVYWISTRTTFEVYIEGNIRVHRLK